MSSPARARHALLALILCMTSVHGAEPTEIRVGSEEDFRPYCFTDMLGRPAGFGIDLMKAVADKMGLRMRISSGTWDRIWNDLVAGSIDALPMAARTPGREKLVDFCLPHTETFDAFFVRKGSQPFNSITAADGKEIVVLRSDAAHHELIEHSFSGTIIPVESIPEGLRLVSSGRHDAFLCSKLIGTLEAHEHGIRGLAAGPPIPDYKRVFSFAVRKGNAELMEKLNQGLRMVKASGEYDRIYARWLGAEPAPPSPWWDYFWRVVGILIVLLMLIAVWRMARKTPGWDDRLLRILTPQRLWTLPPAWRYVLALAAVAAFTALRRVLIPWLGSMSPYNLALMATVATAVLLGTGPGLLTIILGDLAVELAVLEASLYEAATLLRMGISMGVGLLIVAILHAVRVAAMRDRKNAERLAAFDAATFEGIVESEAGLILDCNEQFARLAGRSVEKLKGTAIADLIAPEDRDRVLANIQPNLESVIEHVMLQADGARIVVETHGRPVAPGGTRRHTVVRDITARKAVEEALHRHSNILSSINRILAMGLGHQTEEEFCRSCLDLVEQVTASGISFIGEIGADGFLHDLAISNPGWDACAMRDGDGHRTPPGDFPVHGIYGRVLSGGASLIVNDPGSHPDRIGLPEGHPPLSCFLGVPLLREGGTIGMIAVGNRPGGYRMEDRQILEAVAPAIVEALDRKRAEGALRASEEKYRNLFENMTEEVHFWRVVRDENGNIKTWRLVDANPPTLRTWGRAAADEIRGKTTDEIFGPGATEHYRGIIQKIMAEGVPHSYEDYFPNLDKYFRFTSVPLGEYFITTGADITAIKKAEQSLRESEEQFRILTQNLQSAIALVDDQGAFIIVNNSFMRIFEIPEGTDILNINSRDWSQWRVFNEDGALLDVDDHPVRKAALTHSAVKNELIAVKPPSSPDIKWLLVSAEPILNERGDIHRLICTYYDITERKHTEEALRRSEARWNAAIESFAEGAIIATEDEQVIYWNPAARAMHGFTGPGEGIGPLEETPVTFELWTLDGSHLLELDEWPMRRIKRGETVRDLELLNRRPDQGWEKVFSYSGVMVDTAGGERLIFLTCRNLTELRGAEEALRESEQRFRLALRNAPVSVAVQDRDLRYLWAYNQRSAQPEQIIGHTDYDIFKPGDAERFTAIKRRVIDEGIEQREQAWIDRPTGRMYLDICWEPVRDETGKVVGVASATLDLTPIKVAEEALRRSREDLDRAQEVGQIGWWRLDTRRNVLTWSAENYRIFGVSEGTPLNYEAFLAIAHPDDRVYVDTQWQAGLRGEPYDIEHRIIADGRIKWVREKAYLEFDGENNLLGGFGITQDITARKEAEEMLRSRTDELARSNEDLQQFAYVASHDLQEPLRAVSGFLRLLEERYKPQLDDKAREYIGFAVEGAARMSQLVSDLLAFSRVASKAKEPRPTDAGAALAGALDNLRGAIHESGAAVAHDDLPAVMGDSTQLTQLFQNLIGNAIKFRSPDRPCRVHVSAVSKGGMIEFAVRDNGIGIPSDSYDRIFVIFQRLHTREKYPGTGIGLAICKKIVERHGGQIRVESRPGEGSTFFFTLPEAPQ